MGGPTNAGQGATTTHTATITDDDDPPSLSINNVSVAEDTGTAQFTVTLSPASGKTVSVDYVSSGNCVDFSKVFRYPANIFCVF